MAKLGVPQDAPSLAVAVSGGRDSLALTLLAAEWCRGRGILLTALTVDHALRPESRDEALQVSAWLRNRGIAHQILTWHHPEPVQSRLQERARKARYDLLEAWCLQHGVEHLLLGHHFEDQQETILMRQSKGTDDVGRAGMSAQLQGFRLTLHRPLLATPRARLTSTLEGLGQPWIEDPSNHNRKFARVRLRQDSPPRPSLEMIRGYGQTRQEIEATIATFVLREVQVMAEGYAEVSLEGLTLPVFKRLIQAFGGQNYPKRGHQLQAALTRLYSVPCQPFTLGGALLQPKGGTHFLMCREPGLIQEELTLEPGTWRCWDRRFWLRHDWPCTLHLRALKLEDWSIIKQQDLPCPKRLPWPVPLTLPALYDDGGLFCVPPLRWIRSNARISALNKIESVFKPRVEPVPQVFKVI
ncbi:MAG: tRNA lysidine(34) synthetase TilS [Holosporales bacterium]